MAKSKKHLEGRSKQQRQRVRKQLGPLKNLTIQPRTRARYDKAKQKFYHFLDTNSLSLPRERSQLDFLLCDYLEHLCQREKVVGLPRIPWHLCKTRRHALRGASLELGGCLKHGT